jgi:branched-chain amino acid transport system permease protein
VPCCYWVEPLLVDIFLQQIINGVVLGSVYALVALGYTMVYGILGLINFAHGEVVMIGAMVALAVINALTGSALPGPVIVLLGLLVAMPTCMALGYGIERFAYRPLRHAPRLAPLITAIGVSIVLQNSAMIIWGRQYIPFPPLLPSKPHFIAGAVISDLQIFIVLLAALIMVGLLFLVHRTRLGRAMRATAQNAEVAGLMGVNINTIISITFVVGSALAAVAGVMVSGYYGLAHYYMGFSLGLKAFTAAVLGGIGNFGGAMLGGLLLGIIESLGAGYIGPLTGGFLGSNYQDVFAFFVLILVLVFRPSGLLGERIAERA